MTYRSKTPADGGLRRTQPATDNRLGAEPTQPHSIPIRTLAHGAGLSRNRPNLTALRDKGDNFANPHSLFPTFRLPNSSALATGHFLATGIFSNTEFTAYPVKSAGRQARPMGQDLPLTSCRAGFFLSRTPLPMH